MLFEPNTAQVVFTCTHVLTYTYRHVSVVRSYSFFSSKYRSITSFLVMASALGPCQWTPCPIFHPRNFNTQLVPVEEANTVYICQAPCLRGRGGSYALHLWFGRMSARRIICVECGVEECGANFHAVQGTERIDSHDGELYTADEFNFYYPRGICMSTT